MKTYPYSKTDFPIPMSALATANLLQIRELYGTIADVDIWNLKSLFTEPGPRAGAIWTESYTKKKMVHYFWQSIDIILKDIFCAWNICYC